MTDPKPKTPRGLPDPGDMLDDALDVLIGASPPAPWLANGQRLVALPVGRPPTSGSPLDASPVLVDALGRPLSWERDAARGTFAASPPSNPLEDLREAVRRIRASPLPAPTLANVFAVEGFLRGVLALCGPGEAPSTSEEPDAVDPFWGD